MTKRSAKLSVNRHALYEAHGCSAAIASGDIVLLLGQVGSRSDGSQEPDFAAQARLAFPNLEPSPTASGCIFDNTIGVTTFRITNAASTIARNTAVFTSEYNVNESTAPFAPRAV